jgi:hypothetical protein
VIGVINVGVLRRALEHITTNPKEWDQRSWARRVTLWPDETSAATEPVCKTVCCLAGTIVVRELGARPRFPDGRTETSVAVVNNEILTISEEAAELLGIPFKMSSLLFRSSNDLYRLWAVSEYITAGDITVPLEVAQLFDDRDVESEIAGLEYEYREWADLLRTRHLNQREASGAQA